MLNICRCLTDRVGALPCSDVLQLTESDVETNMMIIVVVILSVTGILMLLRLQNTIFLWATFSKCL